MQAGGARARGAGWGVQAGGCRLGVQAGGAGWGCRLGVQAGGAGWGCRLGVQAGGAGWGCRLGVQAGGCRLGVQAGGAGWGVQAGGAGWGYRLGSTLGCKEFHHRTGSKARTGGNHSMMAFTNLECLKCPVAGHGLDPWTYGFHAEVPVELAAAYKRAQDCRHQHNQPGAHVHITLSCNIANTMATHNT